ncbi:Uma2 family endonuclease [Membranihabitans maritimus]|uniref:Uma2 family endonuclease n=1 Tax=Membranihabitans maritimus TaxID=2904244 RepID=UPI001F1FDF7C|nr:Uma2 family endonuclease [Membranihabitans maritimus]
MGYKTPETKPITKVEDLDFSKIYSYRDYLSWTFEERLEIIKGKIFRMSPAPYTSHQRVSQKLNFRLMLFLQNHKCEVFTAPFDVRLPGYTPNDGDIYTVLQPDLCVICDPSRIDEKGCLGTPDLVVEILSPDNNRKELHNKFDIFEESGVLEYGIIHPAERTVVQYQPDDKGRYQASRLCTIGDTIHSAVLPGFELKLKEVFGKN